MKLSIHEILLGLVTVLALSACSKSSDDNNPDVAPALNYDTQSCVYEATEGSHSLNENLTATTMKAGPFAKEFNMSLLQGILKANVVSTIQFINHTGATVYKAAKAPTQGCSRDLFASAQALPIDLAAEWNAVAGTTGTDGILLGLFLPLKTFNSTQDTTAIIVRENVNRWTLIHEFMHHLFTTRAEALGFDDSGSLKEARAAVAAYKAIKDSNLSTTEKNNRYVDLFPRYYQAIDVRLVHFTLEEVAVEKTLKDEYNADRLQFAPPSSNWYLNGSASDALEFYTDILQTGNDLVAIDTTGNASGALTPILTKTQERITEIRRIQAAYPIEHHEMIAGIFGQPDISYAGCGREHEMDELLNEIRDLNQ